LTKKIVYAIIGDTKTGNNPIDNVGAVFEMTKISPIKLILIILSVVVLTAFLTACGEDEPQTRLPERHVFNPGAIFATNINDDDPRRVLRASVMFEVLDEMAGEELIAYTDAIRNSVLVVLGSLTREEVTTEKDLVAITERIVTRVNEDIGSNFHIPLITGASFTEFILT